MPIHTYDGWVGMCTTAGLTLLQGSARKDLGNENRDLSDLCDTICSRCAALFRAKRVAQTHTEAAENVPHRL